MSDNPLENDPARDQRIRERAYELWEADGRPHGADQEYWERAREIINMYDSAGSGQIPNPLTHGGDRMIDGKVVEEASIQENLGEFPDRLSDQGDRKPTPSRKNRKARG
jgi:hypothetical protein